MLEEWNVLSNVIVSGISLFLGFMLPKLYLRIRKQRYPIESFKNEIFIRASAEDFLYVGIDSPSTISFNFIVINMSQGPPIILEEIKFDMSIKSDQGIHSLGNHVLKEKKEIKQKEISEIYNRIELNNKHDSRLKEIMKTRSYYLKISNVKAYFRTSLYDVVEIKINDIGESVIKRI